MKEKLIRVLKSKTFKRFAIGAYFISVVVAYFTAINPEPFLRFGYGGVFVYNILATGIVLVPIISRYMNVFVVAALAALGMAINDSVSWVVGKNGDVILPRSKKVKQIEDTLHKYGPWGLFFFSMIPMPYDAVGVIAGYLEFPFWSFMIPTFFGRFIRFLILGGGSIAIFGKKVI